MNDLYKKDISRPAGRKSITLSETIAMAIVPIAAYATIFVYYAGYFSKFEIPLEFISFNLTKVFIITGGLILLIRALVSVANVASIFFLNNAFPAPIRKRVFALLPVTIFSLAYILIYNEQWERWLIFLVIAIFSYIAVFAIPLLTTRKIKGTYSQKLEIIDERNRQDYQEYDTLYDRFIAYTGYDVFQILYYFALSLFIVYNIGISSAENQKLYRVVNTTPESVVLYMTDNRMVCSPFNRMTKELEPSIFILEIGADPDIFVSLEQVGPLQLDRSRIYPTQTATPFPTPTATILLPTAKPTDTPNP